MSKESIEGNVKPTLTEVIDHPWLISPAGAGLTQASWATLSEFDQRTGKYKSSTEITASTTRTAAEGLVWLSRTQTTPSIFLASDKDTLDVGVYTSWDKFNVVLRDGAVPDPAPNPTPEVVTPSANGTRVTQAQFHAAGWYEVKHKSAGQVTGRAYILIEGTGPWTETIHYQDAFKRPHTTAGRHTAWEVSPASEPTAEELALYPKSVTYTITRAE